GRDARQRAGTTAGGSGGRVVPSATAATAATASGSPVCSVAAAGTAVVSLNCRRRAERGHLRPGRAQAPGADEARGGGQAGGGGGDPAAAGTARPEHGHHA